MLFDLGSERGSGHVHANDGISRRVFSSVEALGIGLHFPH